MSKIKIAIVGATGYTGVKLIEILQNHPYAEIKAICSGSNIGNKFSDLYPTYKGLLDLKCISIEDIFNEKYNNQIDLVFFATPNNLAHKYTEKLSKAQINVIDLSADFRFNNLSTHNQFYKFDHKSPKINSRAIYGLVELNRKKILSQLDKDKTNKQGTVIANPGCYTTASILALAPFIRLSKANEIFDLEHIIIDAKSGISGAGRNASIAMNYNEINESLNAYNLAGRHRHGPEIKEFLDHQYQAKIKLIFSPHLVPMTTGIHSTLYIPLKISISKLLEAMNVSSKEIPSLHQEDIEKSINSYMNDCYKNDDFISVADEYPKTSWVKSTNRCILYANYDRLTQTLILCSVIDNTVKGASGQAIQNMNLLYALPETTGLKLTPSLP